MFWLTYCDPSGRLLGVEVQDSGHLMQARLKATDQGAQFFEGHEVDEATAKLVPATAVGRMLNPDEAAKRTIERGIPKRPPPASVQRRKGRRTRVST